MGDIKKLLNVISEGPNGDSAIATTPHSEKKEQIFRQATTGTTATPGTQSVFTIEIEQSNRILDDISFRYNFQNTHATANCYIYNGFWNMIDRLEIKINGSQVGDFPLGSVNLMHLAKLNNYENFTQFVSDCRGGSFSQTVGNDDQYTSPNDFRLAVVNGQSPRFESSMSEILKCLYKTHVKYIRNLQIIFYWKSGTTNPHKIIGYDTGFNYSTNFSIVNLECCMNFTVFKDNYLPVSLLPKITFYEEFYEDRLFDLTGLTTGSIIDIRLDTNYRSFMNIKKIFLFTDNTATNATHDISNSYNVFNSTDIVSVEVLNNGLRYAIFDSARAFHLHQQKYHRRRGRRREHSWLTYSEMTRAGPNSFIDCDRNDLILSNDGHHRVNLLSGWTNQVNVGGEWRLRVQVGNTFNATLRPNLHVCLEVAHVISLFSDPNKNPYFQQ